MDSIISSSYYTCNIEALNYPADQNYTIYYDVITNLSTYNLVAIIDKGAMNNISVTNVPYNANISQVTFQQIIPNKNTNGQNITVNII